MKANYGQYISMTTKENYDYIKTPKHLDSFCLSSTEITSGENLPLQVEEIVLDDTEQGYWIKIPHKKFVRWHNKQCPTQLREILRCD